MCLKGENGTEPRLMIVPNLNWLAGGAALGLLAALAITIPAHYDNPFLTAPGLFLGLVVAGIGSLASVMMLLLVKRRSRMAAGLCGFFLMMLAVLVLAPSAWPYPMSDEAKPLTDVEDP